MTYREEGGLIVDPHIGVGGAEDRPRRIVEAENALKGIEDSTELKHKIEIGLRTLTVQKDNAADKIKNHTPLFFIAVGRKKET